MPCACCSPTDLSSISARPVQCPACRHTFVCRVTDAAGVDSIFHHALNSCAALRAPHTLSRLLHVDVHCEVGAGTFDIPSTAPFVVDVTFTGPLALVYGRDYAEAIAAHHGLKGAGQDTTVRRVGGATSAAFCCELQHTSRSRAISAITSAAQRRGAAEPRAGDVPVSFSYAGPAQRAAIRGEGVGKTSALVEHTCPSFALLCNNSDGTARVRALVLHCHAPAPAVPRLALASPLVSRVLQLHHNNVEHAWSAFVGMRPAHAAYPRHRFDQTVRAIRRNAAAARSAALLHDSGEPVSAQGQLLQWLASHPLLRQWTLAVKLPGDCSRIVLFDGTELLLEAQDYVVIFCPPCALEHMAAARVCYTDHMHDIEPRSNSAMLQFTYACPATTTLRCCCLAVVSSTSPRLLAACAYFQRRALQRAGLDFQLRVHVHDMVLGDFTFFHRVVGAQLRHYLCLWHNKSKIGPRLRRAARIDKVDPAEVMARYCNIIEAASVDSHAVLVVRFVQRYAGCSSVMDVLRSKHSLYDDLCSISHCFYADVPGAVCAMNVAECVFRVTRHLQKDASPDGTSRAKFGGMSGAALFAVRALKEVYDRAQASAAAIAARQRHQSAAAAAALLLHEHDAVYTDAAFVTHDGAAPAVGPVAAAFCAGDASSPQRVELAVQAVAGLARGAYEECAAVVGGVWRFSAVADNLAQLVALPRFSTSQHAAVQAGLARIDGETGGGASGAASSAAAAAGSGFTGSGGAGALLGARKRQRHERLAYAALSSGGAVHEGGPARAHAPAPELRVDSAPFLVAADRHFAELPSLRFVLARAGRAGALLSSCFSLDAALERERCLPDAELRRIAAYARAPGVFHLLPPSTVLGQRASSSAAARRPGRPRAVNFTRPQRALLRAQDEAGAALPGVEAVGPSTGLPVGVKAPPTHFAGKGLPLHVLEPLGACAQCHGPCVSAWV